MKKLTTLVLALALAAAACQGDTEPGEPAGDAFGIVGGEADENGKPTFGSTGEAELRVGGKEDSVSGRLGLPVGVDDEATAVWEAANAWEDTDTPAARRAGIAWGADSGLTWEEKFERWVASLEQQTAHGSSRQTYTLTTPWGHELPAPALECAEQAIFLRVAFSSWYQLPFFLEAADAEGRIYFGHFGMRREDGRFARTPNFRDRYEDFSSQADAIRDGASWPSDPSLAGKRIPGSFDDAQPALGPDAHAGAYFDRVFLNKRVGHFMITTLAYFGSIHLADSRNTFNVVPEGVAAGDVLVERWQRRGIGHVLLVMEAREAGQTDGQMQYEVEVASGSMPRRQPVWESPGASKRYFTLSNTGGPGYAELGGGLKRWRIAREVDGRWANVVSREGSGDWVDSSDLEAIAQRTTTFGEILVELTPEKKRDVLLDVIESRREHLRRYPSSCSARIGREEAFDALYELMSAEFGVDAAETDERFRRLEDYVFAELEYGASKTCCWNSSTADMYEVAMALNAELQEQSEVCADVVVFKNRDDATDGYQVFQEWAAANGRGDQWVAWSADESCPQADVAEDTEVPASYAPFCDRATSVVDPVEPGPAGERIAFEGTPASIPDDDAQGVTLTLEVAATGAISEVVLDLNITHSYRSDLSVTLVHPDGTEVVAWDVDGWDSDDDVIETITVPGFEGTEREGTWSLIVRDEASSDTGSVVAAGLTIR
jgi:hypothetical protein